MVCRAVGAVKLDFTASLPGPMGPFPAPFLIPGEPFCLPPIFGFRGPFLALVQFKLPSWPALRLYIPSQLSQSLYVLPSSSFTHFSYESYTHFPMEITLAFGIAVGGIFLSLAPFKIRHRIRQFLEAFSLWMKKHFVYPQCLCRHRYLGPWRRADVLLQSVYFAMNVFCLI
jgi:hypothetical protein